MTDHLTDPSGRADRRAACANSGQIDARHGEIAERTDYLFRQPVAAQPVTPSADQTIARLSRTRLLSVRSCLSPCDLTTLRLLAEHRYLTSRHVAELVFMSAATELASHRAAQRQLRKLREYGLTDHLPHRIGGLAGGQAQTVWHLTEAGWRLLDLDPRGDRQPRHRFREPSAQFLAHTLRIGDIRAIVEQVSRNSDSKQLTMIQTEPDCWRGWTGAYGVANTLRPDLYVELADRDYDYFYFIEADLGSEHQPAIAKKAAVYQAYRNSGREQAKHEGVFPLVLWITPDQRRAEQILATIRDNPTLDEHLHQAIAIQDFANWLGGPAPP